MKISALLIFLLIVFGYSHNPLIRASHINKTYDVSITTGEGRQISKPPEFLFHYIEKDAYWITSAQQTTLSDIDNDGDLDFTTGNVHQNPSLFWYEYIAPDKWTKHVIGSDDDFYGGAVSLDVNSDGRTDIISSEYLFINKRGTMKPYGIGWDKYFIGTGDPSCHCMVKADLNQDGKMDIITNSGNKGGEGLCWYEMSDDPLKPWVRHEIGGEVYFAHGALDPMPVGDLDGDGDLDVAGSERHPAERGIKDVILAFKKGRARVLAAVLLPRLLGHDKLPPVLEVLAIERQRLADGGYPRRRHQCVGPTLCAVQKVGDGAFDYWVGVKSTPRLPVPVAHGRD
ncbi:MAG TPA: hypothetical protein DCP74_10380 [Bacteroidales bacterium]|nr:hypothetical protein [Bacteroidales bacterium]